MLKKTDLGRKRSQSVSDLTELTDKSAALTESGSPSNKDKAVTPGFNLDALKVLDFLQDEMDNAEVAEKPAEAKPASAKPKSGRKSINKKKKPATSKKELQFHDVTPGAPPGLTVDSAATSKSRKRPVENRVSRVNEKKKPMIRVRSNSVSALGDGKETKQPPPRSEILQWQGELEDINLGFGFGGMDTNLFSGTNVPSQNSHQYQQQTCQNNHQYQQQASQNSNDKYRNSNANSDFGTMMGLQNTQNRMYNNNLNNIGMNIRDSLGMGFDSGAAMNSPMNGLLNNATGGGDKRNQRNRDSINLNMLGLANQGQPHNAMFQALPNQMNQMNLNGMNYDNLVSRQAPPSAGPNVFVTPGTPLPPGTSSMQSFDMNPQANVNFAGQQQTNTEYASNGTKPELGRTSKSLSTVFREILSDQAFVPERKPPTETQLPHKQQHQVTPSQHHINTQHNQLNPSQHSHANPSQYPLGRTQGQQIPNFNLTQGSPMTATALQQLPGTTTAPQQQLLGNTTYPRPLNNGLEPLDNNATHTHTRTQGGMGLEGGFMMGNSADMNFKDGATSLPSVTGLRLPSDIMRVMDAEFGNLAAEGATRESAQSSVETENDFLSFLDRESNALPRLPHR